MMTKVVGLLALTMIAIQFIPYGKEHRNPPVVSEPQWGDPRTRERFFHLCGDCHSNETKWPWYSKVAPLSWLTHYDVDEAREHFNVSRWGSPQKNRGDQAACNFEDGEMPPWRYLVFRQRFSEEAEKNELINGLIATFGRPDKPEAKKAKQAYLLDE